MRADLQSEEAAHPFAHAGHGLPSAPARSPQATPAGRGMESAP